jgi:hypothetical protein
MVTCVGAAIGATAAYLFFTQGGRQLRRRLEPAIDDLSRELIQLRGTVAKAAAAAGEGWKLLNEAVGERPSATMPHAYPRQTNPF